MADHPLRGLPSVDTLLGDERAVALAERHGRPAAVEAIRAALAAARRRGVAEDADELLDRATRHLERPPSLRPALNATGVVVHTNLGRAPLPAAAIERVALVAGGYSNLEYDLDAGARGSRHAHLGPILSELTGAEDGMAVNNNAAAVMLVLAALAEGREVPISRGELIEIGDGFRIPDVLAQSGARLVEVGSTNRTRLGDYARVLGPDTGAVLRVHQSNFRIVGFTDAPSLHELAALAAEHGVPVIDDLGSGQLIDLSRPGRRADRAIERRGRRDRRLLLGRQAAGRPAGRRHRRRGRRDRPASAGIRSHAPCGSTSCRWARSRRRSSSIATRSGPCARSRCCAGRGARERGAGAGGGAGRAARRHRASHTKARVGGGAVPLLELESFACALDGGDGLAAALRTGDPPVVARVQEGRVLLDCRTLTDDECLRITL